MDDVSVAACLSVLEGERGLTVPEFVELLATVDGVYVALSRWYDDLADPPVNPLMLTDEEFADESALASFAADLRADGVLDGLPAPGEYSTADHAEAELQVQQMDPDGPLFVELTGNPTLLLALWLLNPLDGEYKVTEEYSVAGDDDAGVNKRVSFSTTASVTDVTDTLRGYGD